MKLTRILMAIALFAVPLLAGSIRDAQEESFDSRELNFRAYVTLLRADIKAQRKDIVTELMEFNDADAAKFWPIFQQYDAELTTIGDGRMQLIVDYARHYEDLTNDQADALMTKAFELEAQRAQLKKKYFDKMKTALPATQAAKFFLIENQMQHIVDLQISAGLPVVKTASN
jgi:outer membrane murein-binding lipoprotein Lpp